MNKIISWVIKLGTETFWVIKSLMKFIWSIFMKFPIIFTNSPQTTALYLQEYKKMDILPEIAL